MSYDNTNRGSIWKNEDRREGKNDPDFKGSVNVNGEEFWVSAWRRKEGANPKSPALSFTLKPKEQREAPQKISERAIAAMKRQRGDSDDIFDDGIPF